MVSENPDGTFTFRIYYPHAGSVELCGDFTTPGSAIAMRPEPSGWWLARITVPPGDRTFRYIVNGQSAIPDYAAGGLARDRCGMWVSCLHVPEPAATGPAMA